MTEERLPQTWMQNPQSNFSLWIMGAFGKDAPQK